MWYYCNPNYNKLCFHLHYFSLLADCIMQVDWPSILQKMITQVHHDIGCLGLPNSKMEKNGFIFSFSLVQLTVHCYSFFKIECLLSLCLMQNLSTGGIYKGYDFYQQCYIKVVVTIYLRLRNEYQPFSAQNQASDWVTKQVNELNAWFLARNGWNSFLNLRLKVTTTLNIKIVLPSNFFNPHQYKIMDNAPKYLVGCVIQKRFLYTHSLSSLEIAW